MAEGLSMFEIVFALIGAITGSLALIWNYYNYTQEQKGFMKLTLNNTTSNLTQITSKTSVENTSKKPIVIEHAILFIINESIKNRANVMEELKNNLDEKTQKCFRTNVLFDLNTLYKLLPENQTFLHGDEYWVVWLPYYTKDNVRLGPLEILTSVYSQTITKPGTYSIYFCIFAEGLKNGDNSRFRVVHDQIILTK